MQGGHLRKHNSIFLSKKMDKYLFFAFLILLTISCRTKEQQLSVTNLYEGQQIDFSQPMTSIALGSCNRENLPQDMWPVIASHDPQLWIWLGDNIYGDSEDMQVLLEKYKIQKNGEEYAAFREDIPIIGIWDDHDYGVNDGDKNFAPKDESKALMMDFLDVPPNAEVRKRPGAYQSYTFGPQGKRVKILLLDGRYFRDELKADTSGLARYLPNEKGDVLGEAQWAWLEKELSDSDAQIHLIACGIQFIPEEQIYEKWANFPAARQRFFALLEKTQPAHAVLLSGDRHIAELSKISLDRLDYPLYELTASGMTHTWSEIGEEPNQYRVGELIAALNFGLLYIDWSGAEPLMTVEIRGKEDQVLLKEELIW